MDHMLLKAATTATDQGTFDAVISTATPDRDGDVVKPQAMVTALMKWAELGKLVPLAWAHGEDVVGHIQPASVRIENDEVIVSGQIDQNIPLGKEAWRLVKSGTLSFSFGYLIPDGGATKREGGRYDINQLDLFEISVVPVGPANNDTRVLSFKSLNADEIPDEVLDKLAERVAERLKNFKTEETDDKPVDPLKEAAMKTALDVLTGGPQPPQVVAKEEPKPVPEFDPEDLRKRSRDLMLTVLTGIEVTT